MTDELFAHPAWSAVLERAYGFDLRRSADGFPYAVLDDLAGKRVSALPFADYLPLANERQAADLWMELSARFPEHQLTLKTVLAEEHLPAMGQVSRRAVYHRYFPGGAAGSAFRRNVRRAERSGMTVHRAEDAAALDRFQELYHWQRLRKFGGIPQPPGFFAAVHGAFMAVGNGFCLEAVTAGGELAASIVVLRAGAGWFYKFGASNPALLSDRPNDLLFHYLTRRVDEGNAAFLDLGLSGAGDNYVGLRRFKSGTGAVQFPVHYLRGGAELSSAARAFKAYAGKLSGDLVAADSPQATTAVVSENLYRYFA